MDLQLIGKRALVTASAGGIGKAIAVALAAEGVTVLINGRSKKNVEQTIQDIKSQYADAQLVPVVADLGTRAGCDQVIAEYPNVDILINNLGFYKAEEFFSITDQQWEDIFAINIMSGIRLSRYYLKQMLEKNEGRILFISSESAIAPSPEMVHYAATKTMQLSISRSLAELTKGTNVTVNTVMPGSTKTEGVAQLVRDVFPGQDPEQAEKRFMQENRPTSLIERLIRPEEIASLVTFLCSSQASAINGAALRVDGGLVRSVF
jgi:Dehydrogenases with different specificities (related to short-chain alcohol dehydrogenases)